MAVAQIQHIGAREAQEDSLAILYERDGDSSGDVLMLVADGMGGHAGGARASSLVIETFRSAFLAQSPKQPPKERLQHAMHAANSALLQEIKVNPALKGMGTTLVAAWKHDDGLLWLSVGDSPMYLYRAGQLRRLNADHSFFGELMDKVKQGRITLAEAKAHPKRNALRSALTGHTVSLVDINHVRLTLNDTLIVASDGLDTLEEPALSRTVDAYHRAAPQAMCKKLIDATLDVGNPKQDNISLITYMHGAQDRVPSTQSNWTQMSLAGRVMSSWQVITVAALAAVLIVAIALMIWLKVAQSDDASLDPATPTGAPQGDQIQAPLTTDPQPEPQLDQDPTPEPQQEMGTGAEHVSPDGQTDQVDDVNGHVGSALNTTSGEAKDE